LCILGAKTLHVNGKRGLHIPPNAYRGLMRDLDKATEEQAEDAEVHRSMTRREAGLLGGRGHKKAVDHINRFTGTSADYLARRIARDRPDFWACRISNLSTASCMK
jgi:hypothetical protein